MNLYESKVKEKSDAIRKYFISGGTISGLPAFLNISPATFRRYRREYADFSALIDECREYSAALADDRVEEALFRRAVGYDISDGERSKHVPPDVKAAVFWLKNRRPGSWQDKKNIDVNEPLTIKLYAEEKEV